ncbi:hypothetical protein DFQ28_005789 [Apophysomyces sp. BC1034]|nr:hypothetical protein DFQ30_005741 [Apophysomyces sp. BC1015]KAG0176966.1 hypothetical protein DFQ29_005414 [Apophysomyces sp. BC1021]KAG0187842.1 hypothetical protein DFQ28_005789 [Apophysomyces sp. BC1034]
MSGVLYEDIARKTLIAANVLRVKQIITGPNACHSVIISEDGQAWVFGRNERGQLGIGHRNCVDYPVNINTVSENNKLFRGKKIVSAAVGRNHTLLVTESGEVFAAGDNKLGQLGITALNDHILFETVASLGKEKIVEVACGADFTLARNGEGKLFAFGSQEYGQLGNGTDGQYIKGSGKLLTQPQPYPCNDFYFLLARKLTNATVPVKALLKRNVTSIACGTNHSLALDDEGYVYSWGFGGYGRLGHGEQKDLHVPRVISHFAGPVDITRASAIACGSTCSMALDGSRQLLLWGKWKTTGDGSAGQAWMTPRYLYDINGLELSHISGGNKSLFALALTEPTTIAWGQVQNGELGFGEDAAVKTATKPQRVEPLEGIDMISISAGLGHTLFLAKPGNELLQDLPKWPALPEGDDACVRCHKEDNEDQLLLCDKCDAPMHTYCAIPALKSIPSGDWYCDSCHPAEKQDEAPKKRERSKKAAALPSAKRGRTE